MTSNYHNFLPASCFKYTDLPLLLASTLQTQQTFFFCSSVFSHLPPNLLNPPRSPILMKRRRKTTRIEGLVLTAISLNRLCGNLHSDCLSIKPTPLHLALVLLNPSLNLLNKPRGQEASLKILSLWKICSHADENWPFSNQKLYQVFL